MPTPRPAVRCLAAARADLGPVVRPAPVLEDGGAFFPQSVASGEPDAEGVVLWTRAVEPARPDLPLALTLQVARDERFEHRVLERPGLVTTAAHDHTLKVRVTHLTPSTPYHYRFLVEKDGRRWASPGGRTRTGPASCSARPLHFMVASALEPLGREGSFDQSFDESFWRRLLRRDEDFDFLLVPGLNEAGALPGLSARARRDRCRAWRAHPVLRQVYARYPVIVLWEDGEAEGAPCSARGWSARRTLCEYLPVRGLAA